MRFVYQYLDIFTWCNGRLCGT